MLIHHIAERDVAWLEEFFATLTPAGWVIPDWLRVMRQHIACAAPDPAREYSSSINAHESESLNVQQSTGSHPREVSPGVG